ncbi:hypothetical protein BaRGS_00012291 [Batillaria attramentaria]|uniref:Uncharacterized protein n=1 Tax=Batillaria attramentaria TaxID=370345 RepID=A0ABD0LAB5_9CAEN
MLKSWLLLANDSISVWSWWSSLSVGSTSISLATFTTSPTHKNTQGTLAALFELNVHELRPKGPPCHHQPGLTRGAIIITLAPHEEQKGALQSAAKTPGKKEGGFGYVVPDDVEPSSAPSGTRTGLYPRCGPQMSASTHLWDFNIAVGATQAKIRYLLCCLSALSSQAAAHRSGSWRCLLPTVATWWPFVDVPLLGRVDTQLNSMSFESDHIPFPAILTDLFNPRFHFSLEICISHGPGDGQQVRILQETAPVLFPGSFPFPTLTS